MPKSEKVKYGFLHYDVSSETQGIYNKIRRMIGGVSCMLSKSVYLVPWGMRDEIVKRLDPFKNSGEITYGVRAFHPTENESLLQEAKANLAQTITIITDKIIQKQEELKDPNLPKEFVRRMKQEFESLESAIAIFMLDEDLRGSLDKLKEIISAQIEASALMSRGNGNLAMKEAENEIAAKLAAFKKKNG